MHDYFIDVVSKNRNMSKEKLKDLAQGQFFLGVEALNNGLIDEVGSQDEAVSYIERTLNITADITQVDPPESFADLFSSAKLGYGIGQGLGEKMVSQSADVRV